MIIAETLCCDGRRNSPFDIPVADRDYNHGLPHTNSLAGIVHDGVDDRIE